MGFVGRLDMASPRLRGVIVPKHVELARRHAAELNRMLWSWL